MYNGIVGHYAAQVGRLEAEARNAEASSHGQRSISFVDLALEAAAIAKQSLQHILAAQRRKPSSEELCRRPSLQQ